MKFKENPQHFFECTYPIPKGEEIWMKHPTFPVEANNWGYLRATDIEAEDEIYISKTRGQYGQTVTVNINGLVEGKPWKIRKHSSGGGLHKLVYECFTGERIKRNTQVSHINYNPYDNRPENVCIPSEFTSRDRGRRQKYRESFTRNTLVEMVKREKHYTPDSDMVEYFRIIGIPEMILNKYEEYKQNGIAKFGAVMDFGKPETLLEYYDI